MSPQEHEARLQSLRHALTEGEQSGMPQPFDSEAFIAQMNARQDD